MAGSAYWLGSEYRAVETRQQILVFTDISPRHTVLGCLTFGINGVKNITVISPLAAIAHDDGIVLDGLKSFMRGGQCRGLLALCGHTFLMLLSSAKKRCLRLITRHIARSGGFTSSSVNK